MDEVYPIIPAASKALWLLSGCAVLLVGVSAALLVAAYSSGHTRLRIDEAGLTIEGDPFFGRSIAWSELDHDRASAVQITGSAAQRPQRRTLGTGMPGYGAGWFRLASGEKALVFMTGAERAVYVPTHAGWSLLATVDHPESVAERIRSGPDGG